MRIIIFLLTQKRNLTHNFFDGFLITLNKNILNLEENSHRFQVRGFAISEVNTNGSVKIIFQKGIGITLTKKIIDLYKHELLDKRQGYLKDAIKNLTVYMNFFEKEQNIRLVITYIDRIENLMNYTQLYFLSKSIFKEIISGNENSDIEKICSEIVKIPKANGIIGVFVIDKAGFLYFSKVNKDRKNMADHNFQIAGFISAILIYSHDFIEGEKYGLKLEDIDLGDQQFYVKTKNDVIFAYLVEKTRCSENVKRYMQLVMEEFLNKYYHSHILTFKGDLSPFHKFEMIIDQYFNI